MQNDPSETHIPLTRPLVDIIRLHGEPFVAALDGTAFSQGEPPSRVVLNLFIPPHIETLVARVIDLQSIYAPGGDYREHRAQTETIDAEYKQIIDEAMNLNDADFAIFDRHHAVAVLSTISRQLKALPSFDEIMEDATPAALLGQFANSIQAQLHLCGFLQSFTHYTDGRGEVGKIMGENFFHDALGHYCLLRNAVEDVHHFSGKLSEPGIVSELKFVLGDARHFVTQVLDGNLAIAKGQYAIDEFVAAEELRSCISINAARFGFNLIDNQTPVSEGEEKSILFQCSPELRCFGASPALSLVVYNLVKNPIKQAQMASKELPDVQVSIEPSTDGRCTSIFVRDTGLGFSYDELNRKFTAEAIEKYRNGEPLGFVEECLIDEAMRDEIPFKAIGQLLCNRGATTGGGTGIGLALAREIIEEGHQGAIRLYNHPVRGAGVQILLPDVDRSFDREERTAITRGSLLHQMEVGLRSAVE